MIQTLTVAGLITYVIAPSLTLEAIAFEGLAVAITHYLDKHHD